MRKQRGAWSAGVIGFGLVLGASGNAWAVSPTLEATLVPLDGVSGDWFGSAVALDGNTAVVGAPDKGGDNETGGAYVFVGSGTSWLQAELAPWIGSGGYFGGSVAVSGNTVVVGAPLQNVVYVFVQNGTNWLRQAALQVTDGGNRFGNSVAISGDTIVVGEPGVPGDGQIGTAYVFVRNGTAWSLQQQLTTNGAEPNDYFGSSVAVSGDDAVVGASFAYFNHAGGSAFVYHRTGATWASPQFLQPLDFNINYANFQFGAAVAINGSIVAIGAPAWQNHGAVYTFFSNGGTWTDPYYSCGSDSCTAFPVVGQTVSGSRFGASVSLGANGDLVVGAPGSASAYDFAYNPPSDTGENGSWSQVWMTPASAPYTGGTVVGLGVAVSGNTVLIGAPSNATNAVFVEGPPASPPPGTGAPAMADNAPLLGALLLLGGLVALSRRRPRGLAV